MVISRIEIESITMLPVAFLLRHHNGDVTAVGSRVSPGISLGSEEVAFAVSALYSVVFQVDRRCRVCHVKRVTFFRRYLAVCCREFRIAVGCIVAHRLVEEYILVSRRLSVQFSVVVRESAVIQSN